MRGVECGGVAADREEDCARCVHGVSGIEECDVSVRGRGDWRKCVFWVREFGKDGIGEWCDIDFVEYVLCVHGVEESGDSCDSEEYWCGGISLL